MKRSSQSVSNKQTRADRQSVVQSQGSARFYQPLLHYLLAIEAGEGEGVLECDDDGPAGFSPNLLEGCAERVLGCCFTLSS